MPQPTIPKTQKAIVSDSADKGIEVREIPVIQQKDLEAGTALVKILYTGLYYSQLWSDAEQSLISGYHFLQVSVT